MNVTAKTPKAVRITRAVEQLREWNELIDAFAAECGVLGSELAALDPSHFARVTNCPPWDLRELVVHIVFSACAFPSERDEPHPDVVTITAADYYRRSERATDAYRGDNVDRTQRAARRFPTGHDAITAFDVAWRKKVARLRELDPSRRVAGPDNVARDGAVLATTALTMRDQVITRLLALVAHSADVALTLDREPWPTVAGLAAVTPTLLELLGGDDPLERLGWDEQSFVLAATGRRSLTEHERDLLGERAGRFPLLS